MYSNVKNNKSENSHVMEAVMQNIKGALNGRDHLQALPISGEEELYE